MSVSIPYISHLNRSIENDFRRFDIVESNTNNNIKKNKSLMIKKIWAIKQEQLLLNHHNNSNNNLNNFTSASELQRYLNSLAHNLSNNQGRVFTKEKHSYLDHSTNQYKMAKNPKNSNHYRLSSVNSDIITTDSASFDLKQLTKDYKDNSNNQAGRNQGKNELFDRGEEQKDNNTKLQAIHNHLNNRQHEIEIEHIDWSSERAPDKNSTLPPPSSQPYYLRSPSRQLTRTVTEKNRLAARANVIVNSLRVSSHPSCNITGNSSTHSNRNNSSLLSAYSNDVSHYINSSCQFHSSLYFKPLSFSPPPALVPSLVHNTASAGVSHTKAEAKLRSLYNNQ
jgi:hypothetical protein